MIRSEWTSSSKTSARNWAIAFLRRRGIRCPKSVGVGRLPGDKITTTREFWTISGKKYAQPENPNQRYGKPYLAFQKKMVNKKQHNLWRRHLAKGRKITKNVGICMQSKFHNSVRCPIHHSRGTNPTGQSEQSSDNPVSGHAADRKSGASM